MRYPSIDGLRGIFILAMAYSHYVILFDQFVAPGYHWLSFAD